MAKHIGVMRNGKWVPQYDLLFILQNERGEVLFWQLTMGTAYAAIHDGMESLKSRTEQGSRVLKMVIIDNCCMWRRLLQEMFGEHLVKLDVFHAVQRVSKALSKKHPYFCNFLQDFRLVFRSKGDNGPQRTKPTPGQEILQTNLDFFLKKWLGIHSDDGKEIMTPAVVKEIDNLRKHMLKGCLSGIPSGFGTNRNENLHKIINKRLSGNRLGVQLAVALLSTFFHSWNLKRSKQETTSTLVSFMGLLQDTMKGCIVNI